MKLHHLQRDALRNCGYCGASAIREYPVDPNYVWVLRTWYVLEHAYVSCCPRCQRKRITNVRVHTIKRLRSEIQ